MKRIIIGIAFTSIMSTLLAASVALAAGPVNEVTVIPGDGAYIEYGGDAGQPEVDVIKPDGGVVPPDR